jgi:general secretion pathway protein G
MTRGLLKFIFLPAVLVALAVSCLLLLANTSPAHPHIYVRADFIHIGAALKIYKLNAGTYPTDIQGLEALVTEPASSPRPKAWAQIITHLPTDPWNNMYRYRRLPEDHPAGFEIMSAGKDGQFGTEDDLSSLELGR